MKWFLFLLLLALAWGENLPQRERVEKYKEELKGIREKALERAKEWKIEKNEKGWVIERREERKLENTPTVYVFISSSVPLEVWWRYAHYLVEKKINGVFVLRGCIGGCKYIKPTLVFLRRFLTEEGKNKKGLPVEVWIDPRLFRDYQVKVVPCVAVEGRKKLSCGDWSMEYHLRMLGVN